MDMKTNENLTEPIYLTKEQRDSLFDRLKKENFEIIYVGNGCYYFFPKNQKDYPKIDDSCYACAWITSEYSFEFVHDMYEQNNLGFSKEQIEALKKSHSVLKEVLKEILKVQQ